jgi:prolactin regulatory element-binding protein
MSVTKKNIGFPIYALEWQDDSTIIAAGGGGIGNSGVKNKIVLFPAF